MAQGGTLGLLGSTNVMNVPFSTVNYTSQLIENQQARTAADTLINDASVRLTTGSNGFDDTFQIRGFPVPAGDVGFNGLYGLVSSNRVPAQIIERIELLKGPGALINGIAPGGSVGGGINIVSKRATRGTFHALDAILHERRQLRPPSGDQPPLRREQGVGRSVQRRGPQWRSLDRQRKLADRSRRAVARLSRRAPALDRRCHFAE